MFARPTRTRSWCEPAIAICARARFPLAVELRHEPVLAVRDGGEMICTCARCSALGYGDVAEDILGGALFEDEFPNEELPTLTALAMMHVPGSRWPRHSPGVA